MKVMVVGAAGYLGRHVWKQLEAAEHEVIAVDGLFWGQAALEDLLETTIESRADYAALVERFRPEATIWLGAIAHDPHGKVPKDIQARYTLTVPAAAAYTRRDVVKRFVFASTLSVFAKGPAFEGYPRFKRAAEGAVFGEDGSSILRFGTLFGPGVDVDSYRGHLLLNRMVYDALKHGYVRVRNPKARRPVFRVEHAAGQLLIAATQDVPPGVSNHFYFCRTVLEFGKVVSAELTVPLVVEEGVDRRDYGWDDGWGSFASFEEELLAEDLDPLVAWTRAHLEEIRERRQKFEVDRGPA